MHAGSSAGMRIWPWPGELPAPHNGVIVLSVATAPAQGRRDAARDAIRLAVRHVLAGVLALPLEAIDIVTTPGQAPQVRLAGLMTHGGSGSRPRHAIGCSFSHEDGLSLAAINLHGVVGIDLKAVFPIADWEAVTCDYLGPAVAQQVRATTKGERARALAQAWSQHEAQLKCRGLALTEWRPGAAPDCRVIALQSPAGMPGMVAALALPR